MFHEHNHFIIFINISIYQYEVRYNYQLDPEALVLYSRSAIARKYSRSSQFVAIFEYILLFFIIAKMFVLITIFHGKDAKWILIIFNPN